MHSTVRSTVRATPIVLTPPTSVRAVVDARAFNTSRPKRKRLRDLVRGEPTSIHFAAAAAIYWSVPWVLAQLQGVRLPHDRLFSTANYLMWSGSADTARLMTPLLQLAMLFHIGAAVVLMASALLPREPTFTPIHATATRLYRCAIALPMWSILVANVGRFVADEVYALSGIVTWDVTGVIAWVEAPLIEWMQRTLATPALTAFASNFYTAMWAGPLAFAGILLFAAEKPRALSSLVVAYAVTAICAVPLFVLLPAFEPWTTSTIYNARELATGIRYLSAHPSVETLSRLNLEQHLSAVSALPSLQVAFPLVVALVLRKHGMRIASLTMTVMTATTMFVAVYLGRHWVIDVVAAIPFAFVVIALTDRIRFDMVLGSRRPARPTLKPGEVAPPPDPSVDIARWLSAALFVSGFAGFIYQFRWQRALLQVMSGVDVGSMTLIVMAVVLGLGAGGWLGHIASKRARVPLPQLFAGAQIAIGVFGFLSLTGGFGQRTLGLPSETATTIFAAMLPAPILMGATLALVVDNRVRAHRGFGDESWRQYLANALRSAAAGAIAALLVLGPLGREASVWFAVILNIGVGALAYARSRRGAIIRR